MGKTRSNKKFNHDTGGVGGNCRKRTATGGQGAGVNTRSKIDTTETWEEGMGGPTGQSWQDIAQAQQVFKADESEEEDGSTRGMMEQNGGNRNTFIEETLQPSLSLPTSAAPVTPPIIQVAIPSVLVASDFSTLESEDVSAELAKSLNKAKELREIREARNARDEAINRLIKMREKEEQEARKNLKAYVIEKLFREVKFVAGRKMFDTMVRAMVEEGMEVCEGNITWWTANRSLIASTISEKRSNINSDMRRRYAKGENCVMDCFVKM